jgi:hypothetical protein
LVADTMTQIPAWFQVIFKYWFIGFCLIAMVGMTLAVVSLIVDAIKEVCGRW